MPEPNDDHRVSRRDRLALSLLIASSTESEIVLAAGTYRERVVVDRPVTLVAAGGPGTVRIVAERGPALVVRAAATLRGIVVECADPVRPAVIVESGAAVFEDCEFHGGRAEVSGSAAPTFRRCQFIGTAHAGLYARNRACVRVERCTFGSVRGHGLVGTDASRFEVHESRVEGSEGAGLRLLGEARADVLSSAFVTCQNAAVAVADTAALRLLGCRVVGGEAEGIRVDGSSPLPRSGSSSANGAGPLAELRGVVIEDCDISDVALEGVVVGGSGQVRLDRSRVTDARRAAVLAGGSARLDLSESVLSGAAAAGILVRGTARVRAAHTDVIACGALGVAAVEHADVELADSRVADSGLASALVTAHAVLRGLRSTLMASRGHGVHARGHAIAELTECRIESCARDAIRIEGSADAVLRESEFARSRIGIVLATRHHPVLRGCRVREVERMGIVVGPGGMPTLTGCSVTRAGAGGIFLDQGSAAQIEDCRIEDAAGGGIVVGVGASPVVRGASVSGTGESGLYFHDGGSGVFERCRVTVRPGGPAAVRLGVGATPELRGLEETAVSAEQRATADLTGVS